MRTLDDVLAANLTKSIARPAISATIGDRYIDTHRPRWQHMHTGSAEAGPSCFFQTYDASFVRLRLAPSTGTIYFQLMNMANPAGWNSWSVAATGAAADRQIAVAWDGNDRTYLVYILSDLRTIVCRYATCPITTWSAPVTITTAGVGHTIDAIAATLNQGSETLTIISANRNTALTTTNLRSFTMPEAGGSVTGPTPWGRPADPATIRALACVGHASTLHVIVAADSQIEAYEPNVNDLGHWPAPVEIMRADEPAITYTHLSMTPSAPGNYAAYYVAHNAVENTDTLYHLYSPSWPAWQLAARPYQLIAPYGVNVSNDTDDYYMASANLVYRAPLWPFTETQPASLHLDASADVLAFSASQYIANAGTLSLTIRNDDGRYATELAALTQQPIKRGSQVNIAIGYRISGQDLVSHLPPYWITAIRHSRSRKHSTLILTCGDINHVLTTTRAPRIITYTASTIRTIMYNILWGIGLHVSDDANAAWDTVLPTFTIQANAPLSTPITRLLDIAGGAITCRTDASATDSPPSTEAILHVPSLVSAYTFGTAHPIASAEYSVTRQPTNLAIAHGFDANPKHNTPTATAYDWADIDLYNLSRQLTILDRRYLDTAILSQIAESAIADNERQGQKATITTDPHPGIEIHDVIHVTDQLITLDADYIIDAIVTDYDTTKGLYSQTLTLGQLWT